MHEDEIFERIDGQRGQLVTFAPYVVERIATMLPAQSKEIVTKTLGISSNTWVKIKRGEPIRASTAYGLANRLALLPKRRRGTSA